MLKKVCNNAQSKKCICCNDDRYIIDNQGNYTEVLPRKPQNTTEDPKSTALLAQSTSLSIRLLKTHMNVRFQVQYTTIVAARQPGLFSTKHANLKNSLSFMFILRFLRTNLQAHPPT